MVECVPGGNAEWVQTSVSIAAKIVGERVRDARRALGATQEELGHFSGIDPTTVGKIERGERNTSLHNLVRIAVAVGLDPGELLKGLEADSVPPVEAPLSPSERMAQRRKERGLA